MCMHTLLFLLQSLLVLNGVTFSNTYMLILFPYLLMGEWTQRMSSAVKPYFRSLFMFNVP